MHICIYTYICIHTQKYKYMFVHVHIPDIFPSINPSGVTGATPHQLGKYFASQLDNGFGDIFNKLIKFGLRRLFVHMNECL